MAYQERPADASGYWWSLPVVAETYDGMLNDINGFHVKERHAFEALDGAAGGVVAEGNVGGGTGMVAYGFKGGIGTSSRVVTVGGASYTVGVLVQANFGRRAAAHGRRRAGGEGDPARRRVRRRRSATTPPAAISARSSSSSPPTRRCCRTS